MRDHDLELYKMLIVSIDKTKKGNAAYQLVKGSKEGGYEKGCFKITWRDLKAVCEITTPQDKVTLKKDYMSLSFEEASQSPRSFVLKLAHIRDKLNDDYEYDIPLVTFLEDIIDRLPSDYKTKKEKWLVDAKNDFMKKLDLMLALDKEHMTLFPEFQKKGHETALVMDGQPKVKCYTCGQWGHKCNNCPKTKKKKKRFAGAKSKYRSRGDKKSSSKEDRNQSHLRCHHCKKMGHVRNFCPKLKDKMEYEDRANEGAYTHVDVVLAMDIGVEVVMDRTNSKYCGVCMVQDATKVACPPYEAPLMNLMKYPYMGPIGVDSDEEDGMVDSLDSKTARRKNGSNKSNHYCMVCKVVEHTKDVCTYKRIPLKEKRMIGIPSKDGDDTEEIEIEAKGVAQNEDEIETPRMDLENEAESPWSIQSPEAKRQKG
jgi:hypothetical protein